MSLFNDIQNGLNSGFGKSLVGAVSSRVPQVGNILNQANGVLTDLNNGDLFGLSQRLLGGIGIGIGVTTTFNCSKCQHHFRVYTRLY